MLRVPIQQAKPGMVLAHSVYNPEKPEHLWLAAGFKLDQETIERLDLSKLRNVWVKCPSLDFLDDLIDPELQRQQHELYGMLKKQFGEEQERNLAKVDYGQYVSQMVQFFAQLLRNRKGAAILCELEGESEDIFRHGTTVASLALTLGMQLESYLIMERSWVPPRLASDLTALGVGCLLHDIGELSVPEEYRNSHVTAQDMGDPQWQEHTEVGFEMIKAGLDPAAAQVVLNHHQHFNGSGFPKRKSMPGQPEIMKPLSGKDIHVFCRIASIVDRFDGFRHMPDGSVAPVVVALKRLKNPGYRDWFDPVIYEEFFRTVPPFAPGEQVMLNDGQPVVITALNDEDPCNPIVKPIDMEEVIQNRPAPKGPEQEQPEINLTLRGDLHIARVDDVDITTSLY